jgi:hypothetical protein
MSFQNYDGFQGQGQVPEQTGPPPQQQPDMGQQINSNGGGFPPANMGANMGVPGQGGPEQQGGDAKTTLW